MFGLLKIQLVKILLVFSLVLLPNLLSAQDAPQEPQNNIWVIDRSFIFKNSLLGKEIDKREKIALESLLKEDEIQTEELRKQEAELAQKRSVINSESFALLADEFSQTVEQTRADYLIKDQFRLRMISIWRQRFDDIIVRISSAIAPQNGVNMIVDSETVVWNDLTIDISQSLVTVLDREYIKSPANYDNIIFAPIEGNQLEDDTASGEVPQIDNGNNEDISNDTSQ